MDELSNTNDISSIIGMAGLFNNAEIDNSIKPKHVEKELIQNTLELDTYSNDELLNYNPINEYNSVFESLLETPSEKNDNYNDHENDHENDDKGFLAVCEKSGCIDDNIHAVLECYLNLPKIPDPTQNPLCFACTSKQQRQDEQLLALQVKYPEQYIYKSLDEDADDIICYVCPGDNLTSNGALPYPNK
jgi:hypothetical protein